MPRKKPSNATANALVQTDPAKAVAVIDQAGGAPGKIVATTRTVVTQQGDALLASAVDYRTRGRTIPDAEVFFVKGNKAKGDGPWLGEADKVAWRDMDSGYECIMMREPNGGYLGGYVGIPVSHPLYGFDREAIPADLGIVVHGGISYSKTCDDGPSPAQRYVLLEARRICHPREVRYLETRHAGDYRVEDHHAWWFGFTCDHLYDRIPGLGDKRAWFLAAETEAVYRDDAYVIREITNLAAQLKAIADGRPMPAREGPPPPPIGLEPDGDQ